MISNSFNYFSTSDFGRNIDKSTFSGAVRALFSTITPILLKSFVRDTSTYSFHDDNITGRICAKTEKFNWFHSQQ